MFIVDDKKTIYKTSWALIFYNYNTWKLLAWCLYMQSGLSYRFNTYVGVSSTGITPTV